MKQCTQSTVTNILCQDLDLNTWSISLNSKDMNSEIEVFSPLDKMEFIYEKLLIEPDARIFKNIFYYLAEKRYFNSNCFILYNVEHILLKKLKQENLIENKRTILNIINCNTKYKINGLIDHIISKIRNKKGIIVEVKEFNNELYKLEFTDDEKKILKEDLKYRKIDNKVFFLLSKENKRITLAILNYYQNIIKEKIKENKTLLIEMYKNTYSCKKENKNMEVSLKNKNDPKSLHHINFYSIKNNIGIREKNTKEILKRLEELYISLNNFLEPTYLY